MRLGRTTGITGAGDSDDEEDVKYAVTDEIVSDPSTLQALSSASDVGADDTSRSPNDVSPEMTIPKL